MIFWNKLREKGSEILSYFSWDLGVDMGSCRVRMYLQGKGLVVNEPSLVARISKKRFAGFSAPRVARGRAVAFGEKAKEMLYREPKQIEVIKPIKAGLITDIEAAEVMIAHYLKIVGEIPSRRWRIFKPRISIAVPGGLTGVQLRALKKIFMMSGAREVVAYESVVMAAIGVGIPKGRGAALAVIDVGGNKTVMGLVTRGGVVVERSLMIGGEDMDVAIANMVRIRYGVAIGLRTAERVKIGLLSGKEENGTIVRGRSLENGLPVSIKLTETEVEEAVASELNKIIGLVKGVLDESPPELMESILKQGVVLTGEGSRMIGVGKIIEKEIGVPAWVVDDPGEWVIKGLEKVMATRGDYSHLRLLPWGK